MSNTANAIINIALSLACFAIVVAAFAHAVRPRTARLAPTLSHGAIMDASMEYQVCMKTGYSARAARSHARAYIARRYAFLDGDTRAAIMRAAITNAQMRINERNNIMIEMS